MAFLASHVKVLIIGSPKILGGCAGLKRPASILTVLFVSFPPIQLNLGWCCCVEIAVTVKAFVLKGLPPPHPWPLPGLLLGVDLYLPPPPPHPLPLFGFFTTEPSLSIM